MVIEKDIANSEAKIENLNGQLAAPGFYETTPPNRQQEVINQKDTLEKKRENDLNTWEEKMDELETKQ